MKVLVVDDNRVDRVHIRRIVERMPQGYTVDEAGDAGEALLRLLDEEYVCVFLDFMLPDMNGAELIRTLFERMTEAPPIILLSNSDDENTI
ncbi:MAG: response regulator [Rhodocyclaceae bacterium]|nr:response regulator [Rhodocyclaceae bacterium]MBX3670068.1 response regulator [Rhodocyclaceae bacterium]